MSTLGDKAMFAVLALAGIALVKYLNLVPIALTVGAMLFAPGGQ